MSSPRRARYFWAPLTAVCIAAAGCGGGSSSTTPAPSQNPTLGSVSPTVYLGALASGSGSTPLGNAISQTAVLEAAMHRTLALHLHYMSWSSLKSIGTNPDIRDDIAHHRVPVIAWNCSDDLQTPALNLTQITKSAAALQDLRAIGQQIAQLRSADGSPYPVLLRYFWEFNLNSQGGSYTNANGNGGCFVGGDPTQYPGQFIAAWKTVATTLKGLNPAPNVSLVWNPSVSNTINNAGPYQPFYPAGYVDWIGFDGYNKENPANADLPPGFNGIFAASLNDVTSNTAFYGSKPIIIAETGSCNQYTQPGETQAAFLAQAESTLKSGVAPWSSVKAFVYFSSPGNYTAPGGAPCTWTLGSGLAQWITLASDSYFQAAYPIP